ncbi:MAG TPA: hypothetical protein HPP95_00470 [Deltaproteobacteria bacterium]|nr:hypothetical protein [Deltaproteobacteria bacterium]
MQRDGCPTKAFGHDVFNRRVNIVGKKIVILHQFVKKTDKTPVRELGVARRRMKEVKNDNP